MQAAAKGWQPPGSPQMGARPRRLGQAEGSSVLRGGCSGWFTVNEP